MRRVPRTSTRQATRTRRLTGRWLAAALIVGAVALLAPGVSYATAGQASPVTAGQATAGLSSPASAGCTGVTPAVFPALGFITNSARTQGGHLWWRRSAAGTSVCVGTVVEWVQYNVTTAKTWRVIVYSAAHPGGQVVASRTFTLGQGWYLWSFGVHQAYSGLSAVCVTADDSFGVPCIQFGQP
ncbi:MAG TPA: hypothetical protein VK280_30425 [Streptosporangiaceae bacterium]|nr:hypothetical protein [Streptosporangiaceae bacterium]